MFLIVMNKNLNIIPLTIVISLFLLKKNLEKKKKVPPFHLKITKLPILEKFDQQYIIFNTHKTA